MNENQPYQELTTSKNLVYSPCDFACSKEIFDKESSEYSACSFNVNDQRIQFRVAKITPTKVGQFVTLWKRIPDGPIAPFDSDDKIDLAIICVRRGNDFGQFVFPKTALIENDILSMNGKGGKRGFRVYPPWDDASNKQAKKTQTWQLDYFLDIPHENRIDCARTRMLYQIPI